MQRTTLSHSIVLSLLRDVVWSENVSIVCQGCADSCVSPSRLLGKDNFYHIILSLVAVTLTTKFGITILAGTKETFKTLCVGVPVP
jgi:hypothetical protein